MRLLLQFSSCGSKIKSEEYWDKILDGAQILNKSKLLEEENENNQQIDQKENDDELTM